MRDLPWSPYSNLFWQNCLTGWWLCVGKPSLERCWRALVRSKPDLVTTLIVVSIIHYAPYKLKYMHTYAINAYISTSHITVSQKECVIFTINCCYSFCFYKSRVQLRSISVLVISRPSHSYSESAVRKCWWTFFLMEHGLSFLQIKVQKNFYRWHRRQQW